MLTIVVLAGEYYPYFSACSNCINNIAQELKKNHEVTAIVAKNDFNLEKTYNYDGIKIIRFNDFLTCFHKYCLDKIASNKSNTPIKSFYYLLLQIKRIFFTLKNLLRLESIDNYKVKTIVSELERINKVKQIDVIIPVCAPYECIYASIKYKMENPNIKVIPFQLDHFAEANSVYKFKIIKKIRYRRHINLEKKTLEYCTHMFILPMLKSHYESATFQKYQQKITVAEHPLFKENVAIPVKYESRHDKINLVYAGALDLKLRNPTYYFEILSKMPIESRIFMNLYSYGNCQVIIDKYKKTLKNTLYDHGRVSLEEAFNAIRSADILISIGNNAQNEIPSKLFDYLSYGKPIVHFYFLDDDAYIEYLRPYPYALCLKVDETLIDKNVELFAEFCLNNKGKSVCFEDLYKIYYYASPQYVSEQFKEYF